MARGPGAAAQRDYACKSKGGESKADKGKQVFFFFTLRLIRLPQENAQAKS